MPPKSRDEAKCRAHLRMARQRTQVREGDAPLVGPEHWTADELKSYTVFDRGERMRKIPRRFLISSTLAAIAPTWECLIFCV